MFHPDGTEDGGGEAGKKREKVLMKDEGKGPEMRAAQSASLATN